MVVGYCGVSGQLADKNTVSCVGDRLLCLITIRMTHKHHHYISGSFLVYFPHH